MSEDGDSLSRFLVKMSILYLSMETNNLQVVYHVFFNMQLYAIDKNGRPLSSFLADRGTNYQCPDCGHFVRLRRGDIVRPHFYHFTKAGCEEGEGKSYRHQKIQERLAALFHLPKDSMERPFPEIARRADVSIEKKKWVFEIQCSALSQEEAKARENDYLKIGQKLIWILDDKLYDQRLPSPLELYCHNKSFYYVHFDLDAKSPPFFYERRFLLENRCFLWKSEKREVDLTNPIEKNQFASLEIEKLFETIGMGSVLCSGSLFEDELLSSGERRLLDAAQKRLLQRDHSFFSVVSRLCRKGFELVLQLALD